MLPEGRCPSEMGMGQRVALVALEKDDVASLGLKPAQRQPQADPSHFTGRLAHLQRVPGPPPTELFSQSLGQLRPADADALTRFDLGKHVRGRPPAPPARA